MTRPLHSTPLHKAGRARDKPAKLQALTLAQQGPLRGSRCARVNCCNFRQLQPRRPLHTLHPYGGVCGRARLTAAHTAPVDFTS